MKHLANFLAQTIQSIGFNIVRANSKKKITIYSKRQKRRVMTPWVKVPNVRLFQVNTGPYDLLFKLFGIRKRSSSVIEMTKNENTSINRYIVHQILRLDKFISRPAVYWKLAWSLMLRSNSFRVLAINHVFHNWYRNYPLSFIMSTNRKCSKLIKERRSDLDFTRVYIPKGDGLRPLGVPAPEWRLYLHMVANFLTFYLEPSLKSQHGFLPGKGCLSAWKEIFQKKLWERPFIREWDFKDFFGKVSLTKISYLLERSGIPKDLVIMLENINRSNIKYCADFEPEYEKKWIDKKEIEDKLRRGEELPEDSPFFNPYKEFLKANEPHGEELIKTFMQETGCDSLQEFIQLQWALLDSYGPTDGPGLHSGVAQGSPTSPICCLPISQLWVDEGKRVGSTTIMYADDSVDFSYSPIDKVIPENSGIEINESKSGYIKEDGKWLKPLKFLGLTFDGKEFRASTRKGSTLPLTFREKLLLYILDRLPSETSKFSDQVAWLEQVIFNTFPESRLKEIISFFSNKTHTVEKILDYLLKEASEQGKDIRTLFPKDYASPPRTQEDIDAAYVESLSPNVQSERDFFSSQRTTNASLGNSPRKGQTWELIFKSKFIGFVQSRLYGGDWNQTIVQNFHLSSKPESWLEKIEKETKGYDVNALTIYNASSYACHSLANILRYSRRKTERKTSTLVRFTPLRNVRSPKGTRKLQ